MVIPAFQLSSKIKDKQLQMWAVALSVGVAYTCTCIH